MKKLFVNAVGVSKYICRSKLKEGDTAVDATMGNGNDTVFLTQLVGASGKVYAFDIQKEAIVNTKERLKRLNHEDRVELIHDGHENIDKYINEKVNLIIFNLGYLPKGNHEITTKAESTLESIEKSLNILEDRGIILLVIYPGHESGKQEKHVIEEFSRSLNQKVFSVVNLNFINQVNNPPEIICIEKL